MMAAVFLSLLAGWLWRSSEPRYQGQQLSAWWSQWEQLPKTTRAEKLAAQKQLDAMAQSVGTNALPTYLRWLDRGRPHQWHAQLRGWIERTSRGRLLLPERKDRSERAYLCIKVLGSNAAPIIPDLTRLACSEPSSRYAVWCLAAIGPTAVPGLSNVIALTPSNAARLSAVRALGVLGTNARPVAPLLEEIIQQNDPNMNGMVMLFTMSALAEIAPDWSAVMPLLVARLEHTNGYLGAAMGLARLKPHSVVFLLQAVTNEHPENRMAAASALEVDPSTALESRFLSFDSDFLKIHSSLYGDALADRESERITPIVQRYLADTNAVVRVAASNALMFFTGSATNQSSE
jgi:hypothetical protein